MAVSNSNRNTTKIKLQNLVKPAKPIQANPDSVSTGHFFGQDCPRTEIAHKPINVICANNSEMTSTKTKELNIEELPQEARKCHICPDMKNKNLLSVPVLCDAGCMYVFCKHKISIIKDKKIIMEDPRDNTTNFLDNTSRKIESTNSKARNGIIINHTNNIKV